ncbi:MAG: aldehyde dehydrogenase family protein, partial [Desulfobacteraceae bacterium]|nr:aldehyde dehydrogenase family protein [Desulfobacteraceae bacterium]
MNNSIPKIPEPYNEPVKEYKKGSIHRGFLEQELSKQMDIKVDIPLIINGEEILTSDKGSVICPHDHAHVLAEFSKASKEEIEMAIRAALNAKSKWENMPWQERASIFLKAADLISKKYTYKINAATMLNQSKNFFQAEIDATC